MADDAQEHASGAATSAVHDRAWERMRDFGDPDRQANIAFALIVLGIIFVGGLTIWLFYGAQF